MARTAELHGRRPHGCSSTNLTNEAGLIGAINTAVNGTPGTYTVTGDGAGTITIAKTATGTAAPVIAGTDAAWFGGTGTAGSAGGNTVVTSTVSTRPFRLPARRPPDLRDWRLQHSRIGDAAGVIELIGTFDTSQDLADAINSKVAGAYASIDASGHLSISGSDEMAIVGGASVGLTAGTVAATGSARHGEREDRGGC